MKIVREHIYEATDREGPEWEKLKMIYNSKMKDDFDDFFVIIHDLYLAKTDYIENVETGNKDDYEFVDTGSTENLSQYSPGIWMGTYRNCYSFLHEESGNVYYAKKEDVREIPEGRDIEVYKAIK